MSLQSDVRDFLTSRRAHLTPDRAGLPAYGGHRRVPGLRREEVAMLAGMSVDYYIRLERGNLSGASGSVLEALAHALQLDEAEHEHLLDLARRAGAGTRPPRSTSPRVACPRWSSTYSTRSPTPLRGCATPDTTCSRRTRWGMPCTRRSWRAPSGP
ncbi:hypothetical protein GCM10028787_14950 [Brachybacterium horti]